MSRIFIEPDKEELTDAGALEAAEGADDRAAPIADLVEHAELPDDFKELWRTLEELSTEQMLQKVVEELSDAPDRRREVLTTWMAQELGYSRVWRRRSSIKREPLWDVLASKGYRELSPKGEEALAMIGRSMQPARSYLHPSAALATLAIWRHSENDELYQEACQRLQERALPDEPEWLYEVVGVLLEDDEGGDDQPRRSLADLVEFVLEHSYWEVGALLAGLTMVHRYGKWYHSAVVSNLIHACDVAAQQYPQEAAPWLQYMADAAMGGQLTFSWLEEPMRAAIRLSLEDRQREELLRDYLNHRPFDADHSRLASLYAPLLGELRKQDSESARHRLLAEVQDTFSSNSLRSLRLLELMVIADHGGRVGSRGFKLRQAFEALTERDAVDDLEAWLIGLYVRNASLEGHAAQLVRLRGELVDWEHNPFADRDDYEMYLVISDYERAFEQLTCKFDGVTLEHADKYAAGRIKFFVEKRVDPSNVHRLVQKVFTPVEWLGAGLTEIGLVGAAIERGMERFEERVRTQDLRDDVIEQFQQAGIAIEEFHEIATLPVDRVEIVLRSQRQRRLMLGAVVGGISGGLAPFSWGVLSLADIPVMLSITADICSRFCWYFGFDPRDYPELPLEILAVALGGTRPSAIEPMLVRQNLHEHVMRKSLVVGALAHGGVAHLTGKGLAGVIHKNMGATTMHKAGELARRAVSRNLHRRALTSRSSRALPVIGAVLGAALNTALLYDICEAAQAVLTDRFLERKYPEWARHIGAVEPVGEESAG